jgi:NAD(P) transhydrogenase subunit beta
MTAMPEMVSLFNGMGGACAALISIIELNRIAEGYLLINYELGFLVIFSGLIIGSISFAGSIVAWGKLNGRIKDYAFRGQHLLNNLLFVFILLLTAYLIADFNDLVLSFHFLSYLIFFLALLYGVLFVLPIGGADMPVVISLLNSFTGVAAACGGFCMITKRCLRVEFSSARQEHSSQFSCAKR